MGTFKVKHRNSIDLSSPSDSTWSFELAIERNDSDGGAMPISNITLYMYVYHTFHQSHLQFVVDNPGNAYGGATGGISISASIQPWDGVGGNPLPNIYPANNRVRSAITINISGTGDLPVLGAGFNNINIQIRDLGNRDFIHYTGTGFGDVESSWSYRDNLVLSDWDHIRGSYFTTTVWGLLPDTSHNQIVMPASLASEIRSEAPTTSYEGLSSAEIGAQNSNNIHRLVAKFTDPALGSVASVERVDAFFSEEGGGVDDSRTWNLHNLNALPDNNPTWNESSGQFGSILASWATGVLGYQNTDRDAVFNATLLNSKLLDWFNDWATNHKGLGLKLSDESIWSAYPKFWNHNHVVANERPMLIVAYTPGTPPGPGPTKMQRLPVW